MITLERTKSAVEAIRSRVSIRKYTDEPVSRDEVMELLELAGNAPSAFNVQPWRFVVVTDPSMKEKLQEAAMGQPQVGAAPVVVAVVSDMEDTLARVDDLVHPGLSAEKRASTAEYLRTTFGGMPIEQRTAFGRNQTNIALGYLLVALESLGFGSSPMLGFDPPAVREVLGLPEHAEIVALVAFGRPAEGGFPKHRLPIESLVRTIG